MPAQQSRTAPSASLTATRSRCWAPKTADRRSAWGGQLLRTTSGRRLKLERPRHERPLGSALVEVQGSNRLDDHRRAQGPQRHPKTRVRTMPEEVATAGPVETLVVHANILRASHCCVFPPVGVMALKSMLYCTLVRRAGSARRACRTPYPGGARPVRGCAMIPSSAI
jgi:hypothetical protein